MRTTKKIWYYYFALIGTVLILTASCKKDDIGAAPGLTTADVTGIMPTAATSGGDITSDGGEMVTARGVCWSTSSTPTTADSKTEDGAGDGSFTSNITGLQPGTTYYVRAYATNSVGTEYGNQVDFTTPAEITEPTVTTADVTEIMPSTATSGGEITSEGGESVTARGVCWSTSSGPTIDDSKTEDGTGGGSFESNITGLESTTTYYVRAYATNSIGTAYGNEIEFTTIAAEDGLKGSLTYNGYTYETVYIDGREWLAENLRTTKFNDGTDIPKVEDKQEWIDLVTPAYTHYENLDSLGNIYGGLYNFHTIETGKMAPEGWHVPTEEEWYALETYVDPTINDPDATSERGTDAGEKLKATSGWFEDGNGTDDYGFNALGGGYRSGSSGNFSWGEGYGARFWSSTEVDDLEGWIRGLLHSRPTISRGDDDKGRGYSIRLIRDE